jgi:hypothetical protein
VALACCCTVSVVNIPTVSLQYLALSVCVASIPPRLACYLDLFLLCDYCLLPDSYVTVCLVVCDAIGDNSNHLSRDFAVRV